MADDQLSFVKMTGAGNDFILVDNRTLRRPLDWSTLAPGLCDRRYGIGADGLLVLQEDRASDFLMEYYNADGSSGGMCGNGGRCAALYAMTEGLPDSVTFSAVDHLYRAKRLQENSISLQMKDVSSLTLGLSIDVHGHRLRGHLIDTGTPHVVFWHDELPEPLRDEVESRGIERFGSEVRHHARFAPVGANVDIVQAVDARTISMRTFEKGVEGETLACGTGAVASAIMAHATKNFPESLRVMTRSNEELGVSFTARNNVYSSVFLSGPALLVFRGAVPLSSVRREHLQPAR